MHHFIVNLMAGKGKAERAVRQIEKHMRANSLPYKIHASKYPGDSIELARSLSESKANIVAVGGDGTFNEVLNGVDTRNAVLGFIPAGVGNDFARTAGISLKPLKALKDVLNGHIAAVDYINIGSADNMRRCLNVAGTGIDIDVLQRFNVKRRKTKLQYYMCLFISLLKFKGYRIEMTLNGGKESHNCFIAAVANGRYFGGGMKISPESDIYDGKLDIIILQMTKRRKIPGMLLKFLKGKHLGLPITKTYKADSVAIKCLRNNFANIDGELLDGLEFKAEIVPNGFKMYV